jgi:uncharacterized protein (TIGR03118 family)
MQSNYRVAVMLAGLLASAAVLVMADPELNSYVQHNLVSDLRGEAEHFDPNLVNPWGVAFPPTGPFWVADNGTGMATVYDGHGRPFPMHDPIVVSIPAPLGGPAAPTGTVFNPTGVFTLEPGKPAIFLFATEDGTIAGWSMSVNAANAVIKVDRSGSGAVYKGLAMASTSAGVFLYATNFHDGTVEVFDGNFNPVVHAGAFTDPSIPAGFAPFGIHNIQGRLYVTYAKQGPTMHDDVAGPGNGFVNVFDADGNLIRRFASQGVLNSPWGLALAPAGFGAFSGHVLIGNFGDGRINAFNPATGAFRGTLENGKKPLEIDGLWTIIFGNGGNAGDTDTLFFTAGIDDEQHGLFGQIRARHPGGDDGGDRDNEQ